ncbi:MAG TPA: Uma2 family endonuclease [Candidatus Eremiobacteraceae bacterium]
MEIEVPKTKPATEWVNGCALQKKRPRERHSRAQSAFLVALLTVVAPNAVVEILSPGDQRRDVDEKIQVYLAAGADVVLMVDPMRERVDAHSVLGLKTFWRGDVVTHRSLVGFFMKVAKIFEKIPPRVQS